MFGIEYKYNGVNRVLHYDNLDPSVYSSDTWNLFRTTFTVPHDLATAQSASFKIHGPAAGVGIAIDQVKFYEYIPHSVNCNQMVLNGNAEVCV